MVGIAAGSDTQPEPATTNAGRRHAAGIYGAVITAAIIAAVGGNAAALGLVMILLKDLVLLHLH